MKAKLFHRLVFAILLMADEGTVWALETNPSLTFSVSEREQPPAGFVLAVYGLWSRRNQSVGDFSIRNPDVAKGLGLGLGYRLGRGVVPELRTSLWGWVDVIFLPVYIGLRYERRLHSHFTLSPYAGIGPVVWFDDVPEIDVGFDVGMRLSTSVWRTVQPSIGVSYGQPHPFGFHQWPISYVNVTLGMEF